MQSHDGISVEWKKHLYNKFISGVFKGVLHRFWSVFVHRDRPINSASSGIYSSDTYCSESDSDIRDSDNNVIDNNDSDNTDSENSDIKSADSDSTAIKNLLS